MNAFKPVLFNFGTRTTDLKPLLSCHNPTDFSAAARDEYKVAGGACKILMLYKKSDPCGSCCGNDCSVFWFFLVQQLPANKNG